LITKKEEWNSKNTELSWANLLTESIFLQMDGTWSKFLRIKERLGQEIWAEPIWFIDKPVSFPTRIWLGPVYASKEMVRLFKSWVRWWVAHESGYQLSSEGRLGGVKSLQCWLRFILRSLIKALVASAGIMAKFVANLEDGSRETGAMKLLATSTSARGGTTSTREGTTVATTIGKSMTTGSIEVAVTLARVARIASSNMGSNIGEIRGGHLLLESHLMSQEKAVNIIMGDGVDVSSERGNQGIKLRAKTNHQERHSLKIIEGLATSSKGVTESFQFMEIVSDRRVTFLQGG
jgi:hypothetical protein